MAAAPRGAVAADPISHERIITGGLFVLVHGSSLNRRMSRSAGGRTQRSVRYGEGGSKLRLWSD